MSGAIRILNESWIVSTSVPYEKVQGQIAANARDNLVGAALFLVLLAAAAWGLHGAQRRRDVERQNEELRVVDRMKDALLRDVAHELKTPVAKHAMQLEILRPLLKAHRITPQEQRAFAVMEESIRRQQSVVRNLLEPDAARGRRPRLPQGAPEPRGGPAPRPGGLPVRLRHLRDRVLRSRCRR